MAGLFFYIWQLIFSYRSNLCILLFDNYISRAFGKHLLYSFFGLLIIFKLFLYISAPLFIIFIFQFLSFFLLHYVIKNQWKVENNHENDHICKENSCLIPYKLWIYCKPLCAEKEKVRCQNYKWLIELFKEIENLTAHWVLIEY